MKLKLGQKNTRESKFIYIPVQIEAKSMLEIKFMKLKLFSKNLPYATLGPEG